MGEAKRRGPLEERVKESKRLAAENEYKRKLQLAADEAALTPEERARRKAARMKFSTILAATIGMTAGFEMNSKLRTKR